jgi:hypothetical protein
MCLFDLSRSIGVLVCRYNGAIGTKLTSASIIDVNRRKCATLRGDGEEETEAAAGICRTHGTRISRG